MIRMNPQQVHNKSVKRNLFPKQEEYFLNLFTKEGFRTFLETNATTNEGMLLVAARYGVKKVWEHWLSGTDRDDYARDYFMLLKIVQIYSNNDNLWITFVEGLHQHAAIVMCLMCSTFDLEDNKLVRIPTRNLYAVTQHLLTRRNFYFLIPQEVFGNILKRDLATQLNFNLNFFINTNHLKT